MLKDCRGRIWEARAFGGGVGTLQERPELFGEYGGLFPEAKSIEALEQREAVVKRGERRGNGEGVFREEKKGSFGGGDSREQEPGDGIGIGVRCGFGIPESLRGGVVQLEMFGAEFDFLESQEKGVSHERQIDGVERQVSDLQQGRSLIAVEIG